MAPTFKQPGNAGCTDGDGRGVAQAQRHAHARGRSQQVKHQTQNADSCDDSIDFLPRGRGCLKGSALCLSDLGASAGIQPGGRYHHQLVAPACCCCVSRYTGEVSKLPQTGLQLFRGFSVRNHRFIVFSAAKVPKSDPNDEGPAEVAVNAQALHPWCTRWLAATRILSAQPIVDELRAPRCKPTDQRSYGKYSEWHSMIAMGKQNINKELVGPDYEAVARLKSSPVVHHRRPQQVDFMTTAVCPVVEKSYT